MILSLVVAGAIAAVGVYVLVQHEDRAAAGAAVLLAAVTIAVAFMSERERGRLEQELLEDARSPLSPVFRLVASHAIFFSAPSMNFRSTWSVQKSILYCGTMALASLLRMRTRIFS